MFVTGKYIDTLNNDNRQVFIHRTNHAVLNFTSWQTYSFEHYHDVSGKFPAVLHKDYSFTNNHNGLQLGTNSYS